MTFTQRNQHELSERLAKAIGLQTNVEVMGWYTLLIRHFARPFLPFVFPVRRVQGFDYDGLPNRFATNEERFFNPAGALYATELGKLASLLVEQSQGTLLYRLESLYDEILVDEVQDLSGWDWVLLEKLFASRIDIRMVGDIRQSVLSTSPRSRKNKQYAYAKALAWFQTKPNRGEASSRLNTETRPGAVPQVLRDSLTPSSTWHGVSLKRSRSTRSRLIATVYSCSPTGMFLHMWRGFAPSACA